MYKPEIPVQFRLAPLSAAVVATLLGSVTPQTWAQDFPPRHSSTKAILEEVTVTARKREESSQDVPLSVSAYGAEQLDALKVRKLDDLAVTMPNVAMDDIGTMRGYANFSIRGIGLNSSIVSIDPTVGVFIDGVYLGVNNAVALDNFDIQSIEVLRGVQGTLFGRNVTGGAVLVNTRKPNTEGLEFMARVAVDGNPNGDGGLNKVAMTTLSGPMAQSVAGKLALYHNKDDGWFVNQFDGKDFGAAETTIVRPSLLFSPNERTEIWVQYERFDSDGDGPASQSHTNGFGIDGAFANFKRDSFDFSIDEPGFYETKADKVTIEINRDIAFGSGTITNIFGWRDLESYSNSDIDAQPVWLFHAPTGTLSEQWSNELRYNGRFDRANVTTGVYWFDNDVQYEESRLLLGIATGGVAPAQTQHGGGNYAVETAGIFTAVDYELNAKTSLNLGLRYTREEKSAEVAPLSRNINAPCSVIQGTCPLPFRDSESWNSWSPKIGVTRALDEDTNVYAYWTRGQRSGGYNLRNTAADLENFGPGPYDEEVVDNWEIGYKSTLGRRGRLNVAVFYNEITDQQREVNLADPSAGIVQLIRNTADSEILGLEADGVFALTDSTLLQASIGIIDAEYTSVKFDLNGDGVLNNADKDLELPRAAELTWSVGLTNDLQLGSLGTLTSRVSYSYRDESMFTDNNRGYILDQKIVDASLDFHAAGGHWTMSLYGRNLLNEVKHGNDSQLPTMLGPVPLGGTFSPLSKGRQVGIELTYNM